MRRGYSYSWYHRYAQILKSVAQSKPKPDPDAPPLVMGSLI